MCIQTLEQIEFSVVTCEQNTEYILDKFPNPN